MSTDHSAAHLRCKPPLHAFWKPFLDSNVHLSRQKVFTDPFLSAVAGTEPIAQLPPPGIFQFCQFFYFCLHHGRNRAKGDFRGSCLLNFRIFTKKGPLLLAFILENFFHRAFSHTLGTRLSLKENLSLKGHRGGGDPKSRQNCQMKMG